ncbi:MAG: HAD family hydrolase [Ruminococcus sp.]|nr:HAD family hydrolase [Ruminococcus sp.]
MKKTLITDLDDTLYDWIGFFIPAFYALVDELVVITGIDKNVLLTEFKEKHQYYGSVEYPFVTLSLPSIKEKYSSLSDEELKSVLNEAFHRFNSVRKRKLQLYDGVEETLKELSDNNVTIIGYTESSPENGFYRLKRLGVAEYFSRVYTSTTKFQTSFPLESKIKMVDTKKPDKKVLLEICQFEGVAPLETIYIGDSLTKDIYMANSAGVTSVLIQHPKEQNNYYQKLVDITSWTDEDFERENRLKEECKEKNIHADYVITKFSDILLCLADTL